MSARAKEWVGDWAYLAIYLVGAGWLYFSNIATWSIWHDESFTAMLISYPPSEILRRAALDVHPPLFYFIMKIWTAIFGTSLTAMRSFSAVCMLGLIVVGYFLIKKLFGRWPARLSGLFLVLSPYMLRYAQEARMYGVVALLLLSATYVLVTAIDRNNQKLLYLYSLLMALAVYCHYYALFVIPAHWLYLLLRTHWHKVPAKAKAIDLKNKHWWGANVLIGLLLAPWLPTAYKQFNSIQGAFWIPPVSYKSFYSTLVDFLVYRDYWKILGWTRAYMIVLSVGIVVTVALSIYLNKVHRKRLVLLTAYAFMPPVIIFLLSLPPFQPIYNNRYFSLTSVAFYLLLGVLVFMQPLNRFRTVQVLVTLVLVGTLSVGIYHQRHIGNFNPDRQETYTMGELSRTINSGYQEGDAIVSTNISTYFDIRYYNKTGELVRLHADKRPSENGSTSLVYDRDDILLSDYTQLKPSTGIVWLVTDAGDAHPQVPSNWHQLERVYQDYAAIVKYQIMTSADAVANGDPMICAQMVTQAQNAATGQTQTFPSTCLPPGWQAVSP